MAKIFCVGDLNTDLFLYTNQAPEQDVEKNVQKTGLVIGGNAANTAMALGGLKQDVSLVSVIGNDAFTPFLRAELKKAGVKPLLEKKGGKNGVSVIFVRKHGKRGILSNKGALLEMDNKTVEKKILSGAGKNDIVHFGGYYHLPKMRKNFEKLLAKIRKRGAKIFFDTTYDEHGKWELLPFIRNIDVLFANETELRKITGKRNFRAGAEVLLKKGAKKIIVKRGPLGAALFTRGFSIESPAPGANAVNTTGAGDFFNAGFEFGKLNNYSDFASLLCANFVAARKIEKEEYFLPEKKSLERYIKSKNLLCVRKERDYAGLSKTVAREIISRLGEKPDSVLALASGSTPKKAYEELVRACKNGRVDFSRARFLELDEYLNLEKGKQSLANTFLKNFLEKTNFRKGNIMLFDPYEKASRQKKRFEAFIRKNGIDLMLLGIGENSHIAFNEPGTGFASGIRSVELSKSTKRVNAHGFRGRFPKNAITLGLKTIFGAKRVLLIASGEKKARAVKKAVAGKIAVKAPASILQRHRNALIIADKKAAKLV